MNKAESSYTITELCSLFELKQNTYYYQLSESHIRSESTNIIVNMRVIPASVDEAYGKRRMCKELNNMGVSIGIHRTRSPMKKAGITAKTPKKKHVYKDSEKGHDIAPNILQRQFEQSTANIHRVGDITYILHHQGWSY